MSVFSSVAALQPKRNVFNLSFEKKYDCDLGQLIPIYVEDCVPGDKFKINFEAVVRTSPLVAPILHQLDLKVEYFFVPYRLLMDKDKFEEFITGGQDGQSTVQLPFTFWETSSYFSSRVRLSLYDRFKVNIQHRIRTRRLRRTKDNRSRAGQRERRRRSTLPKRKSTSKIILLPTTI